MILITTMGSGSMNLYSRKLSENLDVTQFQVDIYQRIREAFNISWFSSKALQSIWHDRHFIRTLNELGDIVHLPNQHLGRYGNFLKVPYIITVHDLIRYLDLKEYEAFIHRSNLRDRFYLNLDYKGVQKAKGIIAVSQSTKNDLMHYLSIPDERISVVYEGIDHRLFKPVPHRVYDDPYVLFVGSEHPRKNFAGLLKAFSQLKGKPGFKDLKLVKVGKVGGQKTDFRKQAMEVINALDLVRDVVFADFVPEDDLPAYYSGAEVLVLPSFYEGFGFPPLEAMACGCPVITSDTSSLPEVVGEAGIMGNPVDIDSLAEAMRQVLTNSELRNDMVKRGLEQANKFSWEKTARETSEVYSKVANE